MSYDAMKWAYAQPLDPGAKFVLVSLAFYADDDTWSCWPSQETLAAATGQHRSSVVRQVQQLVTLGVLTRSHRRGKRGQRTSDLYTLNRDANVAPHDVAQSNVAPRDNGPDLEVSAQVEHNVAPSNVAPSNVAPRTNQRRTMRQEQLREHPGTTSGGARKRGTRIPDDFTVTDEMLEWAHKETPAVDVARQTDRFIDYWRAVPGAKGVKLDWLGTWRNWMRKQADWIAERGGGTTAGQQFSQWDAYGAVAR